MQSHDIVFTGKNQVELQLGDVPTYKTGLNQVEVSFTAVPELQRGQILVETQRSLISTGTECIVLARNFAPGTHWDDWVKYPFHPGYSNAGRVLEVAGDVTTFKKGDRVAVRATHSQFYITDASAALPIPDDVSDEAATWFGLGSIVQNGVRRAAHELGDTVVIIGLGLLGQLAVQYTRVGGANKIIAIDTAPARLEMARAHGATHTLQMRADEATKHVADITNGRLADVVYDVTGHPAVFPAALGLARRFGKLMLLGDAGEPSLQCLTSDVMIRGITIIAAHDSNPPREATDYHYWTRENMARLFFDYLERGLMRVDDLISHRFAPQEAAQAYDYLLNDRSNAMGVIFDWSQLPSQQV